MDKKDKTWLSFGLMGMGVGFVTAWIIRFVKGESAFGMEVLGPVAVGDLLLIGGFILGAIIGSVIKGNKN